MFQSLTDLSISKVELSPMVANTTYRVRFSGNVTNSSATGILYVRGTTGNQYLVLFVNGYGYGSARCIVAELTKGSAVSYEISDDEFAIDVTATTVAGSATNKIGYFGISGVTPTITAQ